jgi:hypothetical protein
VKVSLATQSLKVTIQRRYNYDGALRELAQNNDPTAPPPPPTPDPANVRGTPPPTSNSDSSKSSGPSTVPLAVAAAGLAPQANGAAVAAKAAAESVGKTLKSGEPLRGVPSETPNITARRPLTEIAEKALAAAAEALANIVGRGASVIAPVPHILLHPNGDPNDPDCGCST